MTTNIGKYVLTEVPTPSVTSGIVPKTDRIIILDRSGSMGWTLDQVVSDTKKHVLSNLDEGELLSLGWFSGVGQHDFELKAFPLNSQMLHHISPLIDRLARPLNTTCFSEISGELGSVIELADGEGDYSHVLFFLTDGCPVPYTTEEIIKTLDAMKLVAPKLSHAVFIGYGDYYNRQLMTLMAQVTNGILIHASNVEQVSREVEKFTQIATAPKTVVETGMSDHTELVFTVSKEVVPSLLALEPTVTLMEGDRLYRLDRVTKSVDYNSVPGFAEYATAFLLSQAGKMEEALYVLGEIGDIHLVNKLSNAFTDGEIGLAENELLAAVTDVNARLVEGSKLHCLPKEDAPCIVEVLEVLAQGVDSKIKLDLAGYKRGGKKSKVKEGYPKFTSAPAEFYPLEYLGMHKSRLNVNVTVKQYGTIDLPENNVGFASPYPTYRYRTYTLIRDGRSNLFDFEVEVDRNTLLRLAKLSVVGGAFSVISGDRCIVPINLTGLPVLSRKYKQEVAVADFCQLVFKDIQLGATIKVLKNILGDEEVVQAPYLTEEQTTFLEMMGVSAKDGSFRPPTEEEEASDRYLAHDFAVSVKSFSSLPTISSVEEKIAKGKKLTASDELLYTAITEVANLHLAGETEQVYKTKLQELLTRLKKEQWQTRLTVSQIKLMMCLTHSNFKEFPLRGKHEVEVEGHIFTIEVRDIEVEF